jgi:hypothetical protein
MVAAGESMRGAAPAVLIFLAVAAWFLWIGALWPGTDREGRVWRAVRAVGSEPSFRAPRDAVYGFIPAGLGFVARASAFLIGGAAAMVCFFVAGGFGYVAIWFAWRPPARLKPNWIIVAEQSGRRPVRMDAWGRGLCIIGMIWITVGLVSLSLAFMGSPVSAAH